MVSVSGENIMRLSVAIIIFILSKLFGANDVIIATYFTIFIIAILSIVEDSVSKPNNKQNQDDDEDSKLHTEECGSTK